MKRRNGALIGGRGQTVGSREKQKATKAENLNFYVAGFRKATIKVQFHVLLK